MFAITVQTLLTFYLLCTFTLLQAPTPCQNSPVSYILYERLWRQRSGLPLDVYILQTQGRMKRERGKEGSRERENYFELWDLNPESSITEGFWAWTQRTMTNIRVKVLFYEGRLCVSYVDEWVADKGDLRNMFKACCPHFAFVSVHSKHLQTHKCSC